MQIAHHNVCDVLHIHMRVVFTQSIHAQCACDECMQFTHTYELTFTNTKGFHE